jgi:hypothetical protein
MSAGSYRASPPVRRDACGLFPDRGDLLSSVDPLSAVEVTAAGPPLVLTLERMTLLSGIPIDELDPGTRPQDDLFRHVNGRWLTRTEIPADRARRRVPDSGRRAENAVREIVEEAASAPEAARSGSPATCMPFHGRGPGRAARLAAISQTLAAAGRRPIPELLETLGQLERLGIGVCTGATDPGNPGDTWCFPSRRYLAAGRATAGKRAFRWRP